MTTQEIIDEALSARPVDQLSPEAKEYRATGKLPTISATPQPPIVPTIAPGTPKTGPGMTQTPQVVPSTTPAPIQPPASQVDATTGIKPTQVGGTFGEKTFARKGEDVFETTGGQMRQVTFGEFQRELQPKGLNLEVLPQLPADKTTDELDEILGKMSEAGLKQEDLDALLKSASQPEKEKTEDVFGDIARSYGLDPTQLFADLKAKPTKGFEDLYAQLYQQEGLGDLKTEIEKLTKQLDALNKDFQGKVDQINENPFVSERTRLGQIDVEEQKFNRSRANIVDLLQLATTRFEKGRDDIRDFADRALDKASEERKFAKEQLDFLVQRTEKELEARRKLEERQAKEKELNFSIQDVGGRTVRFGFDKQGKKVSEVDLGPAKVTKPTETEKDIAEIPKIEQKLLASKRGGEFVDGNVYIEQRRRSRLSTSDFDKRFGNLLSPGDRTKFGIGKVSKESRREELLRKSNGLENPELLTPAEMIEINSLI